MRTKLLCVAAVIAIAAVGQSQRSAAESMAAVESEEAPSTSVPTLAYFYIWFDPTSWNRAKIDLPLAGKYSSDERTVMSEQILSAKAAGIDGFIVSWKRSEKLDRRLAALADVAEENDFSLTIIYQGLDFEREPLPPARVSADLDYFLDEYAQRPAFAMFDKPAVILSGSWRFSADEVAAIGATRRDRMLLLGSEKDVEGIQRLDGLIDGDAYYWSSVNPSTFKKYQEKLDTMSSAVHDQGGLWIAPAAPGFDARLVGGTKTVDRDDGATLVRQFEAAAKSSPDAIGLISWNEFSENSHVEPSRTYGTRYLEVLASILDGSPPDVSVGSLGPFDSSEPGQRGDGRTQMIAVGLLVLGVLVAGATIRYRRRPRIED